MGTGAGLMIDTLGGKEQAIEKRYYMTFPENLDVITDETHPLYDPRVKLPLDEAMVRNIMAFGVHDALEVRIVDGRPVVQDGKQRRAHAIEANKRLRSTGAEPHRVPVKPVKGSDDEMLGLMIFKNEVRRDNNPMAKAKLLKRYLDTGKSIKEAMAVFGCSEGTIRNLQALLDAAPQVQKAVEKNEIPASAAIAMVEQHLPADKQVQTLGDMKASGATRGAAAKQAVKDSAQGKQVGSTQVRPQWTKPQLERLQEGLAEAKGWGKADAADLSRALVAAILGDDKALADYPELAKVAKAARKQPQQGKAKPAK